MKRTIKKCFGIALSVVGGVIGVGFASGREVVTFFSRFGFISLLLCFIAGIAFFVLSYVILINNQNNKNCKIINNLCKNDMKINETSKTDAFFNVFMFILQLFISSAMFAGFNTLLSGLFKNRVLIFIIMLFILIASYFVVLFKNKVIHLLNSLLTFLLVMMIFILVSCLFFKGKFEIADGEFHGISFVMPILYAGMNISTVIPLIIEEGCFLKTKKEQIYVSLFIGIVLFVALFLICLTTLLFGGKYLGSDMIMTDMAFGVSFVFGVVYKLLVFTSIFTTLTTTIRGAVSCLPQINFKLMSFITLLISFAFCFIGFSYIIDYVYPVLGFICVIYLIFFTIKNAKIKQIY